MVNSNYCVLNQKGVKMECKYDVGGCFVINGNEKVIDQEKNSKQFNTGLQKS